MAEAKPLPGWYSRLYHRRLTVCLWLLAVGCVLFLAAMLRNLGGINAARVLGFLYYPGLAFCFWTGVKALADGNRVKAVCASVVYLVWYTVSQVMLADGDIVFLLRYMPDTFFLNSAFLAGVTFLAHILWGEKRFGFIPFIVVLLLFLSDLSMCFTGIPNFLVMRQYHLMEASDFIFYVCQLLADPLLMSAFAVGMLPAWFGSRAVEVEKKEISDEAEDEEDITGDRQSGT